MAYTRHNWQCNETITANLLNNIEDGVEEALECCGYSCDDTYETRFDGSITFTSEDSSEGFYEADYGDISVTTPTIRVTFNGTEYVLEANDFEDGEDGIYGYYGAVSDGGTDFTDYPFGIRSSDYGDSRYIMFYVQNEGTYTFKLENIEEVVETTPCFEKAVKDVVGGGRFIVNVDTGTLTADKTYAEIVSAIESGQEVVARVTIESSANITEEYALQTLHITNGRIYFVKSYIADNENLVVEQIVISSNNGVTTNSESYAPRQQ